MPVILPLDRKRGSARMIIIMMYFLLTLGALTMIYPFLVTFCSSLSNKMDYSRFSVFPRSLFSREERFVKGIATYFDDKPSEMFFRNRPEHWSTWIRVGEDLNGINQFAQEYLCVEKDSAKLEQWRKIAADYADFTLDYDIQDTLCKYDFRDIAGYLENEYSEKVVKANPELRNKSGRYITGKALPFLRKEWGIPYESFFDISMDEELKFPMHHSSWVYPETSKAKDFLGLKHAYRSLFFRPGARGEWNDFLSKQGIKDADKISWPVTPASGEKIWKLFKTFAGQTSPATQTYPYPLKEQWIKYFDRGDIKGKLGIDTKNSFNVADYNRLFGSKYEKLTDIPFPVAEDSNPEIKTLWKTFVEKYYPRRLIELKVTDELHTKYMNMIKQNFRNITNYNSMAGTDYKDFSEIPLPAKVPRQPLAELWISFTKTIPFENFKLRSSEIAYQEYLLAKYGSLKGVNETYGWKLPCIEEANLPFAQAYTVTFLNHEWKYFTAEMLGNYTLVIEFLFVRGRAFLNTVVLVVLSIIATLTVNPLAAYALSRFRLRLSEQILLFLMATMAFPAVVSAIPGFLLMRDLGLLNSYTALVLPGLANGMAIFILKGFFDGIPKELYEAATIDGANELQIFMMVTLPMTTPILAVNALSAFIGAYNGWEWALIVCQRKDYWTISVWLYQLSRTWGGQPAIVMAAFVIASIPTAIVFITCQKIILRGIVVPSMK